MRYACQLWVQSETVSTRRALILQKRTLRIISFSSPRSPSAPLFKSFEILTIFDLVKTLNILFVHQHLNFQLPPDLCNTIRFDEIDHNYSTRSQSLGLLKCPKISTAAYGQKSLYIQSITHWNRLKRLHPNTSLIELSTKNIKLLAKSDLLNQYWPYPFILFFALEYSYIIYNLLYNIYFIPILYIFFFFTGGHHLWLVFTIVMVSWPRNFVNLLFSFTVNK